MLTFGKKMLGDGMCVGSHGAKHIWLRKESKPTEILEIDSDLDFLKNVGAPTKKLIMCYPCGSYNRVTASLRRARSWLIGSRTTHSLATLDQSNILELNRFDTNDFPQ